MNGDARDHSEGFDPGDGREPLGSALEPDLPVETLGGPTAEPEARSPESGGNPPDGADVEGSDIEHRLAAAERVPHHDAEEPDAALGGPDAAAANDELDGGTIQRPEGTTPGQDFDTQPAQDAGA